MLTIAMSLCCAMCGTYLTRAWARRALLDHPNARSSHTVPTPRGGGLGICAGLVAASLAEPTLRDARVGGVLLAIAAISFADDLRPIGSRLRLVAHVGVAALAIVTLGSFEMITVPPLFVMASPLLMTALTLVWLVGLTNAYNFMDGIDGIAGAQAVVAGVAWTLLGSQHDLPTVMAGGGAIAAAALGFLPFNWPRASIFMGDVGSATLGMAFALLPIVAVNGGGGPWAAGAGVLVVWPFIFDASFTIVRRARQGERLLEAHRSHLYQRLVIAGWSHRRTTMTYAGLAALCGVGAVALSTGQWWAGWLSAIGTATVLLVATARAERGLRARATP